MMLLQHELSYQQALIRERTQQSSVIYCTIYLERSQYVRSGRDLPRILLVVRQHHDLVDAVVAGQVRLDVLHVVDAALAPREVWDVVGVFYNDARIISGRSM